MPPSWSISAAFSDSFVKNRLWWQWPCVTSAAGSENVVQPPFVSFQTLALSDISHYVRNPSSPRLNTDEIMCRCPSFQPIASISCLPRECTTLDAQLSEAFRWPRCQLICNSNPKWELLSCILPAFLTYKIINRKKQLFTLLCFGVICYITVVTETDMFPWVVYINIPKSLCPYEQKKDDHWSRIFHPCFHLLLS